CRGLYSCERAARRDERDIRLARLDGDFTEPSRGGNDGVEDRPEPGPARVLSVDELIGGSDEEIRVAESLHHEEGLRVAGHAEAGKTRRRAKGAGMLGSCVIAAIFGIGAIILFNTALWSEGPCG